MFLDTAFAKVVEDANGRHHILIEGQIISLEGPTDKVNQMVDAITRGLRRGAEHCQPVQMAGNLAANRYFAVGPDGQTETAA